MNITKARLKEIIQEELERETGIAENPLEPLGLALESAMEAAQSVSAATRGTPQGETAEQIFLELQGLHEMLLGL